MQTMPCPRTLRPLPPRREQNLPEHFLVLDDSFGFIKMFTGYGFTAHFTPAVGGRTVVRIETFYTPANPAAVLNTLVMRRRLRSVVGQLLAGLRTLAERRHTQPGLTPPSLTPRRRPDPAG
jgi:hypothetical protein